MYRKTPYPILPIAYFLSLILVLIPLPAHLSSWNIGLCAYMIYIAIMNFTLFVNSIIWHDNVRDVPIWCDIVAKVQIIAMMGVRACLLVVSIRFFGITRLRSRFSDSPSQVRLL